MLKILHQAESLKILQLVSEGECSVTSLQNDKTLDMDRNILHIGLEQLTKLGLIERYFKKSGDINYIYHKITSNGTAVLEDNITFKEIITLLK